MRNLNTELNPLRSVGALITLIDFTLSNARRFYSSMGNPSDMKGLKGKAAEEPLSRAVYVRFHSSKVKDKQEKQVTYTCLLYTSDAADE